MTSLKKVAEYANVSLMTVSRALNDPSKLSEKTLAKVKEAIEKLNYIPDLSAQKIRGKTKKVRSIGVLGIETAMTPFSVEIHQAIEQTAQFFGWNMFTVNLFSNQNIDEGVQKLLSFRPDGLIFTSMGLREIQTPNWLKSYPMPIVLANCIDSKSSYATYIPDDYQGQLNAIENILIKGYKKPFFILLSDQILAMPIRQKAILDAWMQAGLDVDSLIFHHLPFVADDPEMEYLAIISLLKKEFNKDQFDIIVCGNDRVAFVVYQYLLSLKLAIPDDIAVLGFDNMVGVGRLFYPPLTTVALPHYEIGKQATLHVIQGRTERRIMEIPCPYVKRNSV